MLVEILIPAAAASAPAPATSASRCAGAWRWPWPRWRRGSCWTDGEIARRPRGAQRRRADAAARRSERPPSWSARRPATSSSPPPASAAAAEAQPITDLRGSDGLPARAGGGADGARAARGRGARARERLRMSERVLVVTCTVNGTRHTRGRQARRTTLQAGAARRAGPDRHQERLRGRATAAPAPCSWTAGRSTPAWCWPSRPTAPRSPPSRGWRRAASCTRCRRRSSSTARCSAASARRA